MRLLRPFPLDLDAITVNIPEDEAPLWLAGTTYGLGAQVIRNHAVYVSAIAGNVGIDPALEIQDQTSTRWVFQMTTNARRLFDGTIGNRTTSSATITVDVPGVAGARGILFFGIRAATIRVQAYDAGDVLIYDRLESMSGRTVYTFLDWFTEPIGEVRTKLVLSDLPRTLTRLLLTIEGLAIEIGEIVIGDLVEIGDAKLGGDTGGQVKWYGRSDFNEYGTLVRRKGPVRNVVRYKVGLPLTSFATVKDIMDRLAGELVGAIGSERRQSTIHLGVLGTVSWDEDHPSHYFMRFQVDGVT